MFDSPMALILLYHIINFENTSSEVFVCILIALHSLELKSFESYTQQMFQ